MHILPPSGAGYRACFGVRARGGVGIEHHPSYCDRVRRAAWSARRLAWCLVRVKVTVRVRVRVRVGRRVRGRVRGRVSRHRSSGGAAARWRRGVGQACHLPC